MMPIIMERVLFACAFMAAFAALVKAAGFFIQWKARRQSAAHLLPAGGAAEEPTLLYFWSTGCSQCSPQEHQIEQAKTILQQAGKVVTVVKVNALERQELVKSMQVMTVPTTVLLDHRGKVAAWNPGLTPWRTIVEQFQTIG
jgi:thiol-disulfide isomerase/thioredoxin